MFLLILIRWIALSNVSTARASTIKTVWGTVWEVCLLILRLRVLKLFSLFFLQEGTDDGTAIMIVANKVDLFEEDSERPVTTQNGKKLAEV